MLAASKAARGCGAIDRVCRRHPRLWPWQKPDLRSSKAVLKTNQLAFRRRPAKRIRFRHTGKSPGLESTESSMSSRSQEPAVSTRVWPASGAGAPRASCIAAFKAVSSLKASQGELPTLFRKFCGGKDNAGVNPVAVAKFPLLHQTRGKSGRGTRAF